jgi:serine/threonine-protein kinase
MLARLHVTTPPLPPHTGDATILAPGDIIARKYRLIRLLGEGGTATVWVAENTVLDTQVAIKILRPALASNPRIVARVRREAKATAAISHKNVVQVFDYGVTSFGAPFIVMELLKGETLAQRVKAAGHLRVVEAVRIIARASKGITVAHAKGIIHRDLKPENIFLSIEANGAERPKVLDFGVSFIVRSGEFQSDTTGLTQAGALLGTPAYMAPEAIMGDKPADGRGDVWSLGVILFELITGKLPFIGTTPFLMMRAVLENPVPSLCELAPGADEALQRVIEKALAKDPSARYPGVREFFDGLNTWLARQETAVSVPRISYLPQTALQLPRDPLDDDEAPTYIGPPLDGAENFRAVRDPEVTPTRALSASAGRSSPPGSTLAARPGRSSRSPTVRARGASQSAFLVAGSLFAVATGLFVTSRLVQSTPAAQLPQNTASATATVVPPPVSSTVPLDVLQLPADAKVFVDGQPVTLPAMVTRGTIVRVRVESSQNVPWQTDVSAEGSVKLVYTGTPTPPVSAPGTTGKPSPRPTQKQAPGPPPY